MEIFVPVVKDISLYREIVKNMVNPLDVLREAKNIFIKIYRNEKGKFSLDIEDDGVRMNEDEIKTFFNLGDSKKT